MANPPCASRLNVDDSIYSKSKIEAVIKKKKEDLPHLYGFPHYKWSREFYESTSKMHFLTAANQASKSSCQIRKCINWATDKSLWKTLWPTKGPPRQFWYWYPAADLATTEYEKKWVTENLPRGAMKGDEIYGWEHEYKKGMIHAIHFKSGVTVYFKFYTQKIANLQASSVHAMFVDEELPAEFYDEISARISATEGYFNMVFTATEGQLLWYRTMERIGYDDEAFKAAKKQIVSLYDCLTYEDGSAGGWTIERIKQREAECSSEAEILRRVMGRFVKEEGRQYSSFDPGRHHKTVYPIPVDWRVYCAVDVASGRKSAATSTKSSAAIVFIAVNPELTHGTVFKMWRGDNVETSAGDILDQYRKMRAGIAVVQAAYDHASKEFGIIASRSSENFIPADKTRNSGTQTLNTLFKHDMLDVFDTEDSAKMVSELMTVPAGAKVRQIQDDLCFTKNTLVYTAKGPLPIACVTPGMLVLTRAGWRRVLAISKRRSHVSIFRIAGKLFECTDRHKFFCDGTFKQAKDISGQETFEKLKVREYLSCLKQTWLSLTVSGFGGIQTTKNATLENTIGQVLGTAKRVYQHFIERFGSSTEGPFQRVMLFTIRMAILGIIQLKILNVSLRLIICESMRESDMQIRSTVKRIPTSWKKSDRLQKLGTGLRRAIENIKESAGWLGIRSKKLQNLAASVKDLLNLGVLQSRILCFAQTPVSLRADEILVSTISKESARIAAPGLRSTNTINENLASRPAKAKICPSGLKDVYNLTVEEHEEYYAQGVLTSNCDALRYCILLIPWDWSKIKLSTNEVMENVDIVADRPLTEQEALAAQIKERRGDFDKPADDGWKEFEGELDFWNEQYGG